MAVLLEAFNWQWATTFGMTALVMPLAKKKNIKGSRAKFWTSSNLNPNVHDDQPPIYCRLCQGEGFRPCQLCNETGSLERGGFSRNNSVRVSSLVGTQWTSVTAIGGKWRHFLCVAKKGRKAKDTVAILSSTCGPVENRIKLQVPVSQLRSRDFWEGGWTTLGKIRQGGTTRKRCTACRGEKKVMCPRCDGLGQIVL